MFTRLFSTIFGATVIFAAVAVPAAAADVNEAKVRVCNSCHGPDGVPPSPTTPIIWGQQLNYLVKQMRDYRSGDRNNSPIMSAIVRDVQEDDAPKLAAYYAAKSWPARQAAAATAAALPAAPPQGIADKIETCRACHAQNFEGGAPAPRLAGLSYEYLVASMKSFADGRRTNNADMPGLMKALTESERDAMAKYLAGL